VVSFNYLDSEKGQVWLSAQFLGACKVEERTGELTYTFPALIEDRLIEPALYSYLSLRAIYQFESKYGLILYEILKRYADRDAAEPYWAVQTSQLRDLLGCRDQLKSWKDFRRRALDPAVDEIGRLSEFVVELFETRQGGGRGGGKVVGVTFRVYRKPREEAEGCGPRTRQNAAAAPRRAESSRRGARGRLAAALAGGIRCCGALPLG